MTIVAALLILVQLLGATGAGEGALGPARAHAAAAALAALEDTTRLEEQLSTFESHQIVDKAMNPLETYALLHETLGLLLDTALATLRHATAATTPSTSILAEAAGLSEQLSNLLFAQAKAPLFFWHGPKWMALSKLRHLVGSGEWHQELKELSGSAAPTPQQLLGGEGEGKGAESSSPVQGKVPAIAVAVDDVLCGAGRSCDLLAHLHWAVAAAEKAFPGNEPAVNLVLLGSSDDVLRGVGATLRAADVPRNVFVSLVLPEKLWQLESEDPNGAVMPAKEAEQFVATALKKLGRKAFDLVLLPYAAFKKQHWPGTRKLLESKSWTYGVYSDVPTAAVAKKLLLERTPKPVAWASPDDLLRPAPQDAVQEARAAGIACISVPRSNQGPLGLESLYYRRAGLLAESSSATAAQLRWAWKRGLAGTLRPWSSMQLATLGDEPAATATAILAAASDAVAQAQGDGAASKSVVETAIRGGVSVLKATKASQEPPSSLPEVEGARPSAPRLTTSALSGLSEQAATYKSNNYVIYRENFFDDETFAAIKAETQRLWRSNDLEVNCNLDGKNRLGGYILDHTRRDTSLYRLIYGNEPFRAWVSTVNGEGPMWPSDFPIELREYGRDSKGMQCHPDLQMYKIAKKDAEFAFTVDNDSRCNVTFFDASGKKHLVQTKANSMMMVRANAATHCVSTTEGGTRSILKFIYVGDYRKSNEFWYYTGNECGADNPNGMMIAQRRAERNRDEAQGGLEL
eukprot:TRINITY_DN59272_c0_g1_i1.p1 TRINITY_DN59272_c0_g1~~TRINITY_DN59272_c0_g1_i1.p1  ORF type:complete len:745 (+),score=141.44 TRINITY_DN59272_c0_g1_i1:32-2266(+)